MDGLRDGCLGLAAQRLGFSCAIGNGLFMYGGIETKRQSGSFSRANLQNPHQSVVVDPVESAQQRKPKWVSVVQNKPASLFTQQHSCRRTDVLPCHSTHKQKFSSYSPSFIFHLSSFTNITTHLPPCESFDNTIRSLITLEAASTFFSIS